MRVQRAPGRSKGCLATFKDPHDFHGNYQTRNSASDPAGPRLRNSLFQRRGKLTETESTSRYHRDDHA
jgi:hypothetical protein